VQVGRRRTCIPGIAHKPDQRVRGHFIARAQPGRKTIQMRVVINPAACAQNGNRIAAQTFLPNARHDAAGCRVHRRPSPGENVLTFMQPVRAARGMPGVGDPPDRDSANRRRQLLVRRGRKQTDLFEPRSGRALHPLAENAREYRANQGKEKKFRNARNIRTRL
jgi:hypothetical protein